MSGASQASGRTRLTLPDRNCSRSVISATVATLPSIRSSIQRRASATRAMRSGSRCGAPVAARKTIGRLRTLRAKRRVAHQNRQLTILNGRPRGAFISRDRFIAIGFASRFLAEGVHRRSCIRALRLSSACRSLRKSQVPTREAIPRCARSELLGSRRQRCHVESESQRNVSNVYIRKSLPPDALQI